MCDKSSSITKVRKEKVRKPLPCGVCKKSQKEDEALLHSFNSSISPDITSFEYHITTPPSWPSGHNIIPPLVMLIAGYRRTGKDTFGLGLSKGSFEHKWMVFSENPNGFFIDNELVQHKKIFSLFKDAVRVAFADELRRILLVDLSLGNNYNFEVNKDTAIVKGKLIRQHLIDVGTLGRMMDAECWSKKTLVPHFYIGNISSPRKPVICTDWRFINENISATQANVSTITLRLYRSTIPIPALGIESEHNLDSCKTMYLITPDYHHFNEAIKMWSFYSNYYPVGILSSTGFEQLQM